MLLISCVVFAIILVVGIKSIELRQKKALYQLKVEQLESQIAAEEARKNPTYDLARAKNAAGRNLEQKTQQYCIKSLQAADEVVKAAYGEEHETSKLLNKEIEKLQKGKIGRLELTAQLVKQQGSMSPEIYETVLDAAMNIPTGFNEVKRAFGEAGGDSRSIARSTARVMLLAPFSHIGSFSFSTGTKTETKSFKSS